MRIGIQFQSKRRRAAQLLADAGREASILLKRRGLQYTLFAAVLAAGAAYANNAAPTASNLPHTPAHDITLQHDNPEHSSSAENTNSTTVNVSSDQSSSGASNQSNTSVIINGQDVPVPADGHIHKEISSDNGTATIDISHQSTSSNGSSNLHIHSHSSSEEDIDTE